MCVCVCYLHPDRKAVDSGRQEVPECGSSCRSGVDLQRHLGTVAEPRMCRDGLKDGGDGGGSRQAGGSSPEKHRADPNRTHSPMNLLKL